MNTCATRALPHADRVDQAEKVVALFSINDGMCVCVCMYDYHAFVRVCMIIMRVCSIIMRVCAYVRMIIMRALCVFACMRMCVALYNQRRKMCV